MGDKHDDESKIKPCPPTPPTHPLLWLFVPTSYHEIILGHNNHKNAAPWRDWSLYIYISGHRRSVGKNLRGWKLRGTNHVIVRPSFIISAGSCVKPHWNFTFFHFCVKWKCSAVHLSSPRSFSTFSIQKHQNVFKKKKKIFRYLKGVEQNQCIIIIDHFVSLALANPAFISIIQEALCYTKCSLL